MNGENENTYNYVTPEHRHHDGTIGRDVYSTDHPATLVNKETAKSGLPNAREIGEKSHLRKGKDY